jgi:transposase, IS30 family
MNHYKQLTEEERYQIKVLLEMGYQQKDIAQYLNRDPSTISRELRRNSGLRGYRPKQAHQFATERRTQAAKHCKLTTQVVDWIQSLLKLDLSPEQISGYLKSTQGVSVSHETIYRYIYEDKAQGGHLYLRLRLIPKGYRKRYGSYQQRGQLVDRVSIDERPAIVEARSRIGDWEGDTIIGKGRKSALLTLVERKTLYTLIVKLNSRNAMELAEKLTQTMKTLKRKIATITFDNGKEFAEHKMIAKELNSDVYFAHPYSSWERGTNENTNGLIRQYFPKGTDFNAITEKDIALVMERLNIRPRKTRNYKAPIELFMGQRVDLLAA